MMDPTTSSVDHHHRGSDVATSASAADPRAVERDALLHRLLDSVKQCQIRFGKKSVHPATTTTATTTATTTLATEAEAQVICLLTNLEATLSHGLKPPPSLSSSLGGIFSSATSSSSTDNSLGGGAGGRLSFWPFLKTFLGSDELARFDNGGVVTDLGKGRAWLRTALNENSLERYFYSLVNDSEKIKVRAGELRGRICRLGFIQVSLTPFFFPPINISLYLH